jgi:phospholipid N-methyltransferase
MTPTHGLVTGAVARRLWPQDRAKARCAAAGAVLPDLPLWARAAWTLAQPGRFDLDRLGYGTGSNMQPEAALHSVFAPAALLAASKLARNPRVRGCLAALAAGWAGHIAADVPWHHTDAWPHLWPVASWRFRSPLSGTERTHHARGVQAAEVLMAVWAVTSLAQHAKVPARRGSRAKGWRDARLMFAAFLRNWKRAGEITPTSAAAVAAMLDLVRGWERFERVMELGGGTGAFTAGILERAGRDAIVTVFELDERLARILDERFQSDMRLRIAWDNAVNVLGYPDAIPADLIVSAVPLTTMTHGERDKLLAACATALAPDGTMLQIQYSHARRRDLQRHFKVVRWKRAWRNLPPAILYCCAKPRGTGEYA